ncbi:MAG: tyrosine-type recombinase/integrase [Planctomycetaceae bacterium]|nr:tyrosine-type recombinase/integrase [Planctomycetaceae bacterium]
MVSNSCPEGSQNSHDNVFSGLRVDSEVSRLIKEYLTSHDFSPHTMRAIRNDLRKLAGWFNQSNGEVFSLSRLTVRDLVDFRNHLHREKRQAVATVNRALVCIRRFLEWAVDQNAIAINPAKQVKEIRRQLLAPKGLERADVRRLLRELELREDIRANAIFHLLLYTGCRVSDVVNLELGDIQLGDRSGGIVFRHGKGNKQRSVPLPLPARKAMQAYLESRPPVDSSSVFVGERGAMTDCGVRSLCRKYSTILGIRLHPHLFRHTMAKQFLSDNENDLVSLAQILGHESLNTTARYSQRTQEQLSEASERMGW